MSTKCCWAVGLTLEELAAITHYMDSRVLKDYIYQKTACGMDIRDKDNSKDIVQIRTKSRSATCTECNAAKASGSVPLAD